MNPLTPAKLIIPAAQYLRMSTEHQKYSLENQADAIRRYADVNSFEIVATYEDAGRSGLKFSNRSGLQALLHDVLTNAPHYRAILVYDISRWGRFQDTDEAAYYEFLCRRSGVQVHYIAEPFGNTGGVADSILKALKRAMAAEYSRELGMKVFAGKKRLIQLGFRGGGKPGVGYRRVLVTENGNRRALEAGQYKALTTDRVTLALGPKGEVEFVRQMFNMALTKRFSKVCRFANATQNLKFHGGKPWNRECVYQLLANPKYCGTLTWHRTTQKLGMCYSRTNSKDWIVVPHAFPGIVEPELFDKVQVAHKKRTQKSSNQQLLHRLKKLCLRKGNLSTAIIQNARALSFKTDCLRRRFGSLLRVYELIGYKPSPLAIRVANNFTWKRRLHRRVIQRLTELFPLQVEDATLPNHRLKALRLDDGTLVRLSFARQYETRRASVRWKFLPFRSERNHITLLCLLRDDGEAFHTFVVMPKIDLRGEYRIKGLSDPWLGSGKILTSLEGFYDEVQAMKERKRGENPVI